MPRRIAAAAIALGLVAALPVVQESQQVALARRPASAKATAVRRSPSREAGSAKREEGTARELTVTRFPQNPLVTVETSASLGDNVNGPTVIRVPDWVKRPLGRYYLYFAHHMGEFIRLAYADSLTGPWKIYEPGVLDVRGTAFFRPQPDPAATLDDFYTHVASPEIHVDPRRTGKRTCSIRFAASRESPPLT